MSLTELEAREENHLRKHGPRVYACAECGDQPVSSKGAVCAECLTQIAADPSDEGTEDWGSPLPGER